MRFDCGKVHGEISASPQVAYASQTARSRSVNAMEQSNISSVSRPYCNRRADYLESSPRRNVPQAIASGDTTLLRKIAMARKSLTDQQRQALIFMADLLDRPAAPPANNQAAKIAAACRSISIEDREKRLRPIEEDIQNPDLDRAFDEMVSSCATNLHSDATVAQFPEIRPAAIADTNVEDASGNYECPECGHVNPGANQFCGMCGAARTETMITPARGLTDEDTVALHLPSSSGIQHHYHYYHHHHYHNSPYLIALVFILLAAIAWHTGWEYGVRGRKSPATSPTTAKATPVLPADTKIDSVPATAKPEGQKPKPTTAQPKVTPAAQWKPNRSDEESEVVWFRRPPKTSSSRLRSVLQQPERTTTQKGSTESRAQNSTRIPD